MLSIPRRPRSRLVLFAICLLPVLVNIFLHVSSYVVSRPKASLDEPFSSQCQEPNISAPRENATIMMLARNEDLEKAVDSITSLEKHFNRWFHYPIVFLNDRPWDQEFVDALTDVASGTVTFDVISEDMWGYPEWIDQNRSRSLMSELAANEVAYADVESYHHMCRFNSGIFYDHPALQQYKWYWRVEPGVSFPCAITYDPFVAMAKSGKKYGYAMALWEVRETIPTLFRHVTNFQASRQLASTTLWKSMVTASFMPWPLRSLLRRNTPLTNADGDKWNLCHYWSNFEIADMDFFRSAAYRELFLSLDEAGGFYYERWGDAPVHSLAAHLLLKSDEIHFFRDIGYGHEPFLKCPGNALGGQLPGSTALGDEAWTEELEDALGCRCQCDYKKEGEGILQEYCTNMMRRSIEPFAT